MTALIHEASTPDVHAWLLRQPPGTPVAVGDWVFAEFSSAVAKKHREGLLSLEEPLQAQTHFAKTFGKAKNLTISGMDFREAGRLVGVPNVNLRAADALHLAICASGKAMLCTRDKRLAEAGPRVGIATRLI